MAFATYQTIYFDHIHNTKYVDVNELKTLVCHCSVRICTYFCSHTVNLDNIQQKLPIYNRFV